MDPLLIDRADPHSAQAAGAAQLDTLRTAARAEPLPSTLQVDPRSLARAAAAGRSTALIHLSGFRASPSVAACDVERWLVAHLHRRSEVALGPCALLDCGALETIELSGDTGLLRAAAGGSLCLLGVEQLDASMQVQLAAELAANSNGHLAPKSARCTRVIATTRVDLDDLSDRGLFDEELLYRLNVVAIEAQVVPARAPDNQGADLDTLRAVERAHIERVLNSVNGNRSRAARILGLNRSTLYARLDAHDLR